MLSRIQLNERNEKKPEKIRAKGENLFHFHRILNQLFFMVTITIIDVYCLIRWTEISLKGKKVILLFEKE